MARVKKQLVRLGAFLGRNARRIIKIALVVLIGVVCFIPSIVINNAIGYVPVVMYVFAIVLSYVYLLLLEHFLRFEEASRTPECIRGESIDFVLRLTNRSILVYPRIEVVFHQSDLFGDDMRITSTSISLAPRAKRDFTFSMRFDHIGQYQAGLKRVVLHDVIGLFTRVYDNDALQTIEVVPRVIELDEVKMESEAPTAATTALKTVLNEGIDYAQVREYRWGDPIKSIHWKISARLDQYMTRVYESNTNPGVTTVIDLCVPQQDPATMMHLFDCVVESGLSINHYARRIGLDGELVFSDDVGEHKRYSARMETQALRNITGLLRLDTSCFANETVSILQEELSSPFAQSNVAVCTANLDDGIVDMVLAIKARRRNPMLFFALPANVEQKRREELCKPLRRLDGTGILFVAISDMDELSGGVID